MAQYPIPQFIEEEGRIIFFLTFRQFFLLVGGGIISALLFIKLPFLFSIIASIGIMALVSIVAFVKVNGMPIIKLVLNYLGFLTKNKNYIWKKKNVD